MESETQAIKDEYRLLTGLEIEDAIDELPPTAPIMGLVTPASANQNVKLFDPTKHLTQLRQTHEELNSLLTTSVRQVERKRQLRALSNVRRKERAAVAAQMEVERLELKKAGRRQKQEVQASTLVLA